MKPNLASEPDAKYPLTFPKFASSKLDGIRGVTQYGTCVTRSLKPIPNFRLRELMAATQGLDGEFICGDPTAHDVYHVTSSAVRTEDRHITDIMFYAFDVMDKVLPYSDRYNRLLGMTLPSYIKVLPQTILNSQDDLDRFYADQLELGYEGAILRNGSALYKEGRATAKSQDMLKFKPFLDSDGIVVDVFEAMTNNNPTFTNELGRTARSTHAENLVGNGMAGGFVIQMGTKVFNISAGKLNHDQRREVLLNKDKYIGKMCTFRHLPIGEKDVPRHGRFYRWKDIA
jgi:DNA ligase-1